LLAQLASYSAIPDSGSYSQNPHLKKFLSVECTVLNRVYFAEICCNLYTVVLNNLPFSCTYHAYQGRLAEDESTDDDG